LGWVCPKNKFKGKKRTEGKKTGKEKGFSHGLKKEVRLQGKRKIDLDDGLKKGGGSPERGCSPMAGT